MEQLDIETPSVVIDLDIAEANIAKYQAYCDKLGLHLRPHVKTHKIPDLAKKQLAAGASGITCQKISEAEAMISEGGIDDILLTYNVLGQRKLHRLRQLSEKVRLSVVADNITCIKGLSETFHDAQTPLTVLVECDTGALRCGVVSPDEALELAQAIDSLPGIRFGGLMTYPPVGHAEHINSFLATAKSLIEASGLAVDVVSIGGSPDMWRADQIPVGTEYRIGTYIYNDRSLIMQGTCEIKDCALTILATVVSTPTPERAVIDAGSKSLTSDLSGLSGHGLVVGYPDLAIEKLSEEHGCITSDQPTGLKVGQQVHIIPNHACVVSNMVDHVVFTRQQKPVKSQPVIARGQVW